ncbi:ArsR/SmtB family transcription factor [Cupriavidus sp. YAF13]|uniref:ArsR/SmtB family transcription factor n=1 Tax=Cupriavidus sp. YAF13 TaxID=3233075 RepID=UPI003F8E2FDC
MRNYAYTNILNGMDEMDRVFEKVSGYFSLLAEPTRLKILHALCDGEKPVGTVVDTVGSSQTNVSRHLTAMYRAGVLSRRKEANLVFYAIEDESVIELCRTVCVQVASRLEDNALPASMVDRFMPQATPAPRRRSR